MQAHGFSIGGALVPNVISHNGETYSVVNCHPKEGTTDAAWLADIIAYRASHTGQIFIIVPHHMMEEIDNAVLDDIVLISAERLAATEKLFFDRLEQIMTDFPNSSEAKKIVKIAGDKSMSNQRALEAKGLLIEVFSTRRDNKFIAHVEAGGHRVWVKFESDYHAAVEHLCGEILAKLNA